MLYLHFSSTTFLRYYYKRTLQKLTTLRQHDTYQLKCNRMLFVHFKAEQGAQHFRESPDSQRFTA